jgi:O-antigen/teichoic acid export membrane protein
MSDPANEPARLEGVFRTALLKTYAAQLAFAGISFLGLLLTARLLGAGGRGELAILILIPTLLVIALEFGQEFTMSHLVAKYSRDRSAIHGNSIAYAAFVTLPGAALSGVGFWIFLGRREHLLALAAAAGIAISTGVYFRMAGGLSIAIGRIRLWNVSRILLATFFVAAVTLLAFSGLVSSTVFFLAWCGTNFVSAMIFLFYLRAWIGRPNLRVAHEQRRIGLPVYLYNLGQFLLFRADQLLLSLLVGSTAVGVYSVAVNVTEVVWYLPAVAQLISIPFLSGDRPDDEKRQTLMQALRLSFWFSAFCGVGLALLSPFAIPLLFGGDFTGAVLPLELLLPGVVAAAVVKVSSAALIAKGRPSLIMRLTLGALVLNLALNAFLIPAFEASGAAVASSVAYTLLGAALLRATATAWSLRLTECLRLPTRLLPGRRVAVTPQA